MTNILLAHGEESVSWGTFGTDWLYLLVPVAGLIGVVAWLIASGKARPGTNPIGNLFVRAGSTLERVTGLPAWAAAGAAMTIWALLVAVIGFLWDVAWHIDFGRDEFLFTPSHMMILIGLASIAVAGSLAIAFATLDRSPNGFRLKRLHIPYSAVPLTLLGFGALAGFPLDELWHQNYGIDVTMWGPTHLVMISGASFAPLAVLLMLREGSAGRTTARLVNRMTLAMAGAAVIGLSTFQAEFDFGATQWQQLFHPVLVAFATGVGLTMARAALGRGGAIAAVAVFLTGRAALAILMGPVFNQTVPRFPLYIGAAVAVELGAWLSRGRSPLRTALVSGALVATLGLGAEWAWMQVWGRHPWTTNLFPGILVAALVAVAGAVLGQAMGRVLSFRNAGIASKILAVAGAVVVAGLAFPISRSDAPYEARLIASPVSEERVNLEVEITPADAVQSPDWFETLSWQGGSLELQDLEQIGPGRYRAPDPVPVNHHWKTFVRLADKDILVAVPLYMPADPLIGASEIPVEPVKEMPFVRDTQYLMREAHAGPAWPAIVAYSAIGLLALSWIASFVVGFNQMDRSSAPGHAESARGLSLQRARERELAGAAT